MKHQQSRRIILTFLLYNLCGWGVNAAVCPNGDTSSDACDATKKCTVNQICLRNLIKDGEDDIDPAKGFCCTLTSWCKSGMQSFHSESVGILNWIWLDSLENKRWFEETISVKNVDYKAACPMPISYQMIEYPVEGLAVGFNKETGDGAKVCKLSSECEADQFCGHVSNPSYGVTGAPQHLQNEKFDKSNDGQALKFCFKLPKTDAPATVVKKEFGLITCNNHTECLTTFPGNDTFCDTSTKLMRMTDDGAKPNGKALGICVQAKVCNGPKMSTPFGSIGQNDQACKPDNLASCQDAGIAKRDSTVRDPTCIDGPKVAGAPIKLCCYTELETCSIKGTVPETPKKACEKYSDCVDPSKKSYEQTLFCDPKQKQCCKAPQRLEGELALPFQCPDTFTALFGEPKCENYNDKQEMSGVCPGDKQFLCKHGHCCPETHRKDKGAAFALPKTTYKSAMPCKPDDAVTERTPGAFCDPASSVYVMMGTSDIFGTAVVSLGKTCTSNKECDKEKNGVCTFIQNGGQCYTNPLIKREKNPSKLWLIMLILSGSAFCCFLIASATCFVCYRSKSFFDGRKKGKKGKGKKSGKTGGKGKKGGADSDKSENPSKSDGSAMSKVSEKTT